MTEQRTITGQLIHMHRLPPMSCGVLAPDGSWCVTGHQNGMLRFADAQSGLLRGHGRLSSSPIRRIVIDDAGWVLSVSEDGVLGCWDSHGTCFTTMQIEQPVEALALSPDHQWLAIGRADGIIHLWNTPALPVFVSTHQYVQVPGIVTSLDWYAREDRLVLVAAYHSSPLIHVAKLIAWQFPDWSVLDTRDVPHTHVPVHVYVHPTAPRSLVYSDGQPHIWWPGWNQSREVMYAAPDHPVHTLAWTPDGSLLAGGTQAGHLIFWNTSVPERHEPPFMLAPEACVDLSWDDQGTCLLVLQTTHVSLWTIAHS